MSYRFDLNSYVEEFQAQEPSLSKGMSFIDHTDMHIGKRLKIAREVKAHAKAFLENQDESLIQDIRNAVSEALINHKVGHMSAFPNPTPFTETTYKTIMALDGRDNFTTALSMITKVRKSDLPNSSSTRSDVMQAHVFDHEVGHALTIDAAANNVEIYGGVLWSNSYVNYIETLADTYSILRGQQRWGDNCGLRDTVSSMRTLSLLSSGDIDHYTAPVIEKLPNSLEQMGLNEFSSPSDVAKATFNFVNKHFDPNIASKDALKAIQPIRKKWLDNAPIRALNLNPLSLVLLTLRGAFGSDGTIGNLIQKIPRTIAAQRLLPILPNKKYSAEKLVNLQSDIAKSGQHPLLVKALKDLEPSFNRLGIKKPERALERMNQLMAQNPHFSKKPLSLTSPTASPKPKAFNPPTRTATSLAAPAPKMPSMKK